MSINNTSSDSASDRYQYELEHCLGRPNMRSKSPTVRRSIHVDLEFPSIPSGAFRALEVPLDGVDLGDEIELIEPWQRPVGLTHIAYVAQAGVVRICAKNKSDRIIEGLKGSYGIVCR